LTVRKPDPCDGRRSDRAGRSRIAFWQSDRRPPAIAMIEACHGGRERGDAPFEQQSSAAVRAAAEACV
jgi:hypothetical protein